MQLMFRPTGNAAATLRAIKKEPAMRHVRFTTRGKGECDKLIIGIAQVHPVLSGRFEGFQAKRIANVQAEIFEICAALKGAYGITSFGQEGLSGDGNTRLPEQFLSSMKSVLPKKTLRNVSKKWRKALHAGKAEEASVYAMMLNALTVLQALHSDVTVYPIEQKEVHGAIGESLAYIQTEIAGIEASKPYREARKKNGKGLTQDEYNAVVQRNAMVQQFNAVMKHPERDRAILREVLKHAVEPVTVFVLGTGHRSGMLTLTAKQLPEGYMFAWAEPPSLWRWRAILSRIGWAILLGTVTYGVWFVR